ncbi:MAG: flagellar export protein FliJ [candidate division Zixibacteria bacterium]|nr:flagellar export protein FliJ [candidate division Zixibacteria bacterium]
MRAFRFRLERLLHLREAEKQQCALELAEKRRLFDQEQRRLRQELRERERVTTSYRRLGRQASAAWSWNSARDAMRAAETRVANQAKTTKAALDEVDQARERLVEKSGEVESYVRLREKQREEHDLAARRAEQKVHDDTAVDRHLQRQREQGTGGAEVLTG